MPYQPTQMPTARAGQAMTRRPQFAQYQAPDNNQTEQLAQQQVNTMLQSGGSLSPDVVSKLKARSKQQALSMADQKKQEAAQFMAARGYNPAGGTAQAAGAQIDFGTINNILGMNRDTDITAATTNRADNLNAVQAATEFMNSRNARSGDSFRNVLLGQTTQNDSDFRVDGFNEDMRRTDNQTDLQRWIATNQAEQAAEESRLRNATFAHGVDMDYRNFGEGARRFDNSLGFNYNQLNANQDNFLMQYLMQNFG
jgi:hypothetical protein